jgi:hypothetical protein
VCIDLLRKKIAFIPVISCSIWRNVSSTVKAIVLSSTFEHFVEALVFINAIVLSIDHYPASTEFNDNMDLVNFVLLIGFCFELCMKLIGLGVLDYISNEFNILDCAVVCLSIADMSMNPPAFLGGVTKVSGSAAAIRAVRLFRVFRLFKLLSSNRKLKVLLEKLSLTGEDLRNFGIPLFLFVFIYAIIGMQLFSNKLRFDEFGHPITEIHSEEWYDAPDVPAANFDNFTQAVAAIFQILTLDCWERIYMDLWRAAGPLSLVYIFSWVCFGVYILTKLFMAILLGNFSLDEVELDLELSLTDDNVDNGAELELPEKELELAVKESDELHKSQFSPSAAKPLNLQFASVPDDGYSPRSLSPSNQLEFSRRTDTNSLFSVSASTSPTDMMSQVSPKSAETNGERNASYEYGLVDDKVMFEPLALLDEVPKSMYGRVKRACITIMMNKYFVQGVLVATVVSALALAFDNPLHDPNGQTQQALGVIDIIVSAFFLLEAVVKIIALDFYSKSPTSYCKDSWNILDMFILIISFISILGNDEQVYI